MSFRNYLLVFFNIYFQITQILNILKKTIELNLSPYIKILISYFFYLNYSHYHSAKQIFSYYKQFDNSNLGWKILILKRQPFTPIKKPKKKLKIGYVSPDFRNHSMTGLFITYSSPP